MKKITLLFSLLLTQFAFAQWDGDFPGDGTFPWQGDSSVFVTDSMIIINGDTILISTNPNDGENPWDNEGWDENDNPWDNDMPFGDSIIVINDSTFVINGDTISLSDIEWDNDWGDDDNDNPWGGNGDDNPWNNDDWDDEWDNDFPFGDSIIVINDSTFVINGDTISLSDIDWDNDWDDDDNDNPWGGNGDDNPWDNDDWDDVWDNDFPFGDSIIVINDSTIVINGDTITFPGGDNGFPGDGENPWDDSTDVENPWEDEIEVINDSTIVINGDTITFPGGDNGFPGDGEWPWDDSTDVEEVMIADCNGEEGPANWINDGYCDDGTWGSDFNCEEFDFDGGDCDEDDEEGEWPWDDSTDVDCPWEDGFPGDSDNEGFDEDTFEDMMEIIEGFDMADDELVLILEQTDVILSILDENEFEFTPTEIDGYLVFGPFSIEDLYTIIMENMEGFEIGWGLFRPTDGTVVADGVITSTNENINNMFNVSMLSLYEADAALEVYKTIYYNILGKEVKEANNGVFIKVMQTNKGEISTKVYIAK